MKNWQDKEDFLLDIEIPVKTKSYSPVPHAKFVNDLNEKIYKAGYEVVHKRYMADGKGQTLTGELAVKGADSEITSSIGFQNSYNKKVKAGVWSGAMVLVCKNGMYTVDGTSYKRKHTGDVLDTLDEHMDICIDNLEETFEKLRKQKEELKTRELSRETISRLLGDMYINESLITNTQLNIIKNESFYSTDFKELNGWSFLNWITEAFKQNTHPIDYMRNHLKVNSYISDKLGLENARGLYGKPLFEQLVEVM